MNAAQHGDIARLSFAGNVNTPPLIKLVTEAGLTRSLLFWLQLSENMEKEMRTRQESATVATKSDLKHYL